MLKNAYILYLDEPKSLKYLQDCVDSCAQFPDINPIPVAGPLRASYKELCEEFGIGIIPYYVDQMATNAQTLNNTFSCNGGHYRIWKKIVESGEAGVVFEHDVVVKKSLTALEPIDGEILWLGPRIHNVDDYNYPDGWESKYVEVDRWEGTHAYAITPNTAQMLLDCLDDYGINDSIDGQLGMRNIFDMRMRAIDPPPVVAVVSGDRQSTIELSGNAATWNAYSTDGFRAGLRAGAEPPLRQLYFTDNSFMKHTGVLNTILSDSGFYDNKPLKVLVIGGKEGMSTLWLSNKLLRHDDSQLFAAGGFEKKNWEIFNFNTYFSKYYYKLNSINCNDVTDLMISSCGDPDIIFDVVYICGNTNSKDTVFNGITASKMLKEGGLIIFDNYDQVAVKFGVDIIDSTTCMECLYKGDFAVYKH
jgi:GR25 family glycosyltransferase involved in LPS biosynthesis